MNASITPRTMLLILAAMFLLPLVLAWLMYTGVIDFQPESASNKGLLVSPPVPLDWRRTNPVQTDAPPSATNESSLEHWVVLHPVEGDCDKHCESRLSSIRQVYLASGRQRDRIRLVVLFLGPPADGAIRKIRSIYQEFILMEDSNGGLRREFETAAAPSSPTGSTYLIDPRGNIMMVYPAAAEANDLKEDLKRLLKWSKLDEQS